MQKKLQACSAFWKDTINTKVERFERSEKALYLVIIPT